MTTRGAAIAELLRHALDQLGELEKTAPVEVDTIVGSLVAHMRSWRPEAVAPFGTLPAPTEVIRDPRTAP